MVNLPEQQSVSPGMIVSLPEGSSCPMLVTSIVDGLAVLVWQGHDGSPQTCKISIEFLIHIPGIHKCSYVLKEKDVVRLIISSHNMLISNIDKDQAVCIWTDNRNRYHEVIYPIMLLIKPEFPYLSEI